MRRLPGPAGTSKDQDGAFAIENNSEIRDQKVDCFASVSYCSLLRCHYRQILSNPIFLRRILFVSHLLF
jgi:hypothetical protein